MAIKKSLFVIAFVITLAIFITIYSIGIYLDKQRYSFIDDHVQQMYNDLNEMQLFYLMADTYGDEMACLAFESKLKEMDKSIWNLGRKIDQYRVVSEEFLKDPYYLQQKKVFNENQVFYLLLLKTVKERCNYSQVIVLFFYRNSADCKKCDDQSYVLTDINKDIDEEIAIFSFDLDIDIKTIQLMSQFYGLGNLPCTIIEDTPYCGMQDKKVILKKICEANENVSVC